MQAPRYVETNPAILRLREKSLSKHYDTLNKIKTKGSRSIDNAEPFRLNPSSIKVKADGIKNGKRYADEQLCVDRANKLLEDKLKAIADRKNIWLQNAKTYTPKSNMESTWKRENKRIHMENEYIAKKLVKPNSKFSVQMFRENYRKVESYKKNISKDPYLKNRSFKNLAPLHTSSTYSLQDIAPSQPNSTSTQERKLTEITETSSRKQLNRDKGIEGHINKRKSLAASSNNITSDDELKKKKHRKSSLDPINTDLSHTSSSQKLPKNHKKHPKSTRNHVIIDTATVASSNFEQKDTETFESVPSNTETLSFVSSLDN